MAGADLAGHRQQIVDAAAYLVRAGVMSLSLHGNMSVRIPGTDTMLLTAQSSFDNLGPEHLALLDLDGRLLEGQMSPASAEIVQMHAVVYRTRPEAGSVLHTHSPYATAFAVASQPIGLFYEAMVRFGMTDGVPVAGYGPRGSDESAGNIATALQSAANLRAVLLENHGVLTFGPDPAAAARINAILEETALLALYAQALGGVKPIPPHLIGATVERAAQFARQGTVQAS